jgi:type IV pilus assembly protein PilM
MSSIFKKVSARAQTTGRPPAAVELRPEGALAASVSGSGAPLFAFSALPPGALTPGIDEANIHRPDLVSAAIRSALDEVSPRTQAVTLILPDTVVRVFVLDFDSLPARHSEALPILRFRLRKMVPFDAELAGVSFQVLSQTETECRVLTAIVPGPVLAEYESAVRAAGYEPGAVLASSLAALESMETMETSMAALLTSTTLTTTIVAGNDLLLYRTLDLPGDPRQRIAEVQRGIAVASAYFEDTLRVRPQRLSYAGDIPGERFAEWLDDPELAVVDLVPVPESGLMTTLGGASIAAVAGALALQGSQAVAS